MLYYINSFAAVEVYPSSHNQVGGHFDLGDQSSEGPAVSIMLTW